MRPMLSPTLRSYSFRFRLLLSLALQPQSLVATSVRLGTFARSFADRGRLPRSHTSVADLRHTRHSRLNSSVTSPLQLKHVIGPFGTLPRHRPYVIPPSIIVDHPPFPTRFNTIGLASSPTARRAPFSSSGPPASASYFLIRYVALTVPHVSVCPFLVPLTFV